MRGLMGKVSIVGQQNQAFTAAVETSDWKHPFVGRYQIDHSWPTLRIDIRGNNADRLIERVID